MQFLTTALLALSAALPSATAAVCSGYQADPSDIAACATELTNRGNEECKTYGGVATTWCQIGGARVVGFGVIDPAGKETSMPW
jgi:hypothetical protein